MSKKKLINIVLLIIIIAGFYLSWLQVTQTEKVKEKIGKRLSQQFYEEKKKERKKENSSIILDMDQAKKVMNQIYKKEEDYSSFNCNHSDMEKLCKSITQHSYVFPVIHQMHDSVCMYVPLYNINTSRWYCIDSTGKAGKTEINPGNSGYCNGNTFVCPSLKND